VTFLIVRTGDQLAADRRRDEVARDRGRLVLAYGEVTGHAHAIGDVGARLYGQELELRFLEVLDDAGVTLGHDEHRAIHLPTGAYEVRRQREYTPEAIRTVGD